MAIVPEHKRTVNIGHRFNGMEVIGAQFSIPVSGRRRHLVVCQCECGKVLVIRLEVRKIQESCGCRMVKNVSKANRRHGECDTRIYHLWCGIKRRCTYPHSRNYKYYGGKGVVVCEEWSSSYEAFRDWSFANGYTDDLTIDRVDSNGNYEPGNCRWVTMEENIKFMHAEKKRKKREKAIA